MDAARGLPVHPWSSQASVLPCGGQPPRAHLWEEEGPGLWPAWGRVCCVNGGQIPGAKQEPSSGLAWVGAVRATSWAPVWEAL